MKKVYIVLIVILVILLGVVAIFLYERAHASLYLDDCSGAGAPAPGQSADGGAASAGATAPESAPQTSSQGGAQVTEDSDAQVPIAEEKNEMGYRQISMADAKKVFDENPDDSYVILDVRRPDEFNSGHIPGAINVANESIGTEKIDELPDLEATIYVYCRSGNRSRQASEKLAAIGYSDVIEFGGIINWPGKIEQ